MASPPQISRFALYGEGNGAIAPEFLHIESISSRSSLYEWTISPHSHSGIFQLLMLEKGGVVLASDAGRARLAPPALVAVPAGCVHAFHFDEGSEGWVLSIALDLLNDPRLGWVLEQSPLLGAEVLFRAFAGQGAGRLPEAMAGLAEGLAAGRSGELARSVVAQLAVVLALADAALEQAGAGAAPAGHGGRHEQLVHRFRRLVEAHFREGWSVERYAAGLGATAPTLTRACRQMIGKAPGEAVLDRLLLEAMRALTYTAAPISQIAADLGFEDPAYFARFFKRRVGMTASHFRHSRAWLTREAHT
ncbi:MAG TPA: helix-turn-helix domain-containing protein [Novosphingobium sp.]|nr:helix-turn-helix domain-containing protein [Novosphingobium sp.]HZV09549.1 helix-turn-helix domain-containing protein [Novosphingobium sp.]